LQIKKASTGGVVDIPRIISVDDHVVEPAHVWREFLPERFRERAPKVVRMRARLPERKGVMSARVLAEDDDAPWADVWVYDDLRLPLTTNGTKLRDRAPDDNAHRAVTYDEIRQGCFDRTERLADMDLNHTDAALCFPTFPRFCGQTFLEREDKQLALLCVQAYNDWMIDEWCGDDGRGRLIPLTIIPLWDAELAAFEIRRCAVKGSHAVAFSENPAALGLPSIHSGWWNPFFGACEETDTVINMHIGSSSKIATTSDDAPFTVAHCLVFQGSMHAVVDWLTSGLLERFPALRIALSEGQVGWMPFLLERLDNGWKYAWEAARAGDEIASQLPRPPSSYVAGRIFGCIFDDLYGLQSRHIVGMDQIMFETDYPHADSTWPDSRAVAEKLISAAELNEEETWKFLRGNAIKCYRLDRYGVS
jgi:predicted TIM-barrel fold metal-dependent hydrolase